MVARWGLGGVAKDGRKMGSGRGLLRMVIRGGLRGVTKDDRKRWSGRAC